MTKGDVARAGEQRRPAPRPLTIPRSCRGPLASKFGPRRWSRR